MKKQILLIIAMIFVFTISNAQTKALQFNGEDCNGNPVNLFADLDSGKFVILHFFMPNCGGCPPPALLIQEMAKKINAKYPEKVKGYAFPFENSTTCSYSSSWVSSNGLDILYAPMDSGETHVAHYSGFGMPTVVLLGGADHRVIFSTLSFNRADTTVMRDSILRIIDPTSGIFGINNINLNVSIYPNPASENITIDIPKIENTNAIIDIISIEGKQISLIYDGNISGSFHKKQDISNLPCGNYLVRFQLNGEISTQKFIVNH